MKKEMIENFCKVNEVELFNKLGIKFEDGVFYNDGMGVFGFMGYDKGVDVSLIREVLIEDVYNEIDEIKIGGEILFMNDYR
jgi:hypothetical protein